jgi:YhcH/YjgK/YiaL family protein
MILDRIENAPLYYALGSGIEAALKTLQQGDILQSETGRHELDGRELFAIVQEYQTRERNQGKWEAHRCYIDIQYIISGAEVIGHTLTDGLTVTEPYNSDQDIAFYSGEGSFLTLGAGMFGIFFPHDAHMPCLAPHVPGQVRKIVFKVRVS